MKTPPWLLALLVGSIVACGPVGPAGPIPGRTPDPAAPTPSATADAARQLEWARVTSFPVAPDGSAITGMTAGGPGFVAVGFDGGSRAMVWVSGDGLTWTAVPHQDAFESAVMAGVTAIGKRLVAVGRDVTNVDREMAAAWVSDDGRTWRRAASEGLEGGQMIRVIAGGPGLISVGSAVGLDAAAVWTSVDGERWERAAHTPALDRAFMWNVTAGPNGFVGVGWRRSPDPIAAAWTSPDGRTWTLGPDLPGGEGHEIRAVILSGDRLIAAGGHLERGGAAAWTSTDGRAWARVPSPGSFAGAAITTLLPFGKGVLALGGRGLAASAWSSPDGTSWSSFEDDAFEGAYLTSGAVDGGRVMAGGATQRRIAGTGSFAQEAAAWRATAPAR